MTIEEYVETKICFHLNIIYGSKTSPRDKAHKVHALQGYWWIQMLRHVCTSYLPQNKRQR